MTIESYAWVNINGSYKELQERCRWGLLWSEREVDREAETFVRSGDDAYTFALVVDGAPAAGCGRVTKRVPRDRKTARAVVERVPKLVARYTATFQPQAWIGDYAVDVDALGPTTWDCSEFIQNPPNWVGRSFRREMDEEIDADGVWVDSDDVLAGDDAAPAWVQQWVTTNPFTITVRRTTVPAGRARQGRVVKPVVPEPERVWSSHERKKVLE